MRDYRRIGDKVLARFSGGRDGTLWYHRALVVTVPLFDEFMIRAIPAFEP